MATMDPCKPGSVLALLVGLVALAVHAGCKTPVVAAAALGAAPSRARSVAASCEPCVVDSHCPNGQRCIWPLQRCAANPQATSICDESCTMPGECDGDCLCWRGCCVSTVPRTSTDCKLTWSQLPDVLARARQVHLDTLPRPERVLAHGHRAFVRSLASEFHQYLSPGVLAELDEHAAAADLTAAATAESGTADYRWLAEHAAAGITRALESAGSIQHLANAYLDAGAGVVDSQTELSAEASAVFSASQWIADGRNAIRRLEREAPALLADALLSSLDEYASYHCVGTPAPFDPPANLVGLGLKLRDFGLRGPLIGDVVPGGPAAIAGLHNGDRLLAIDGAPVSRLTDGDTSGLLAGEPGSLVALTLLRGEGAGRVVHAEATRAELHRADVSLTDQRFVFAGGDVVVIRISSFIPGTAERFKARLRGHLAKGHVCGIVLDLQHCPGGRVVEAIEVAGVFIGRAPVVKRCFRSHGCDTLAPQETTLRWKGPLLVAVDRKTASAAEMLAVALRDHRRAAFWFDDDRTFGKAVAQTSVPSPAAGEYFQVTNGQLTGPRGGTWGGTGMRETKSSTQAVAK